MFSLFWQIFKENLAFFIFEDLTFLETTYGKILPFSFFWTWQPWVKPCHVRAQTRLFVLILLNVSDYYEDCFEGILKEICISKANMFFCQIIKNIDFYTLKQFFLSLFASVINITIWCMASLDAKIVLKISESDNNRHPEH